MCACSLFIQHNKLSNHLATSNTLQNLYVLIDCQTYLHLVIIVMSIVNDTWKRSRPSSMASINKKKV